MPLRQGLCFGKEVKLSSVSGGSMNPLLNPGTKPIARGADMTSLIVMPRGRRNINITTRDRFFLFVYNSSLPSKTV
jgi:hypothetical protein